MARSGALISAFAGPAHAQTRVLYISPLKALSNDIEKNLQVPLRGVRERLEAMGLTPPSTRTAVRTRDTPSSQRTAMDERGAARNALVGPLGTSLAGAVV